jgi:hypothetical protein
MDNHFHVLIHVPEKKTYIDSLELSIRLRSLYGKRRAERIGEEIQNLQNLGLQKEAERRIRGYIARMHDVSEFMKTVKQRFSESYNKRHNRSGTLWGGRFHSVLVQADNTDDMPLLMMGAYIDLNPVRAGLVNDPKEYTWCSYGAAVAGNDLARDGIKELLECYDISCAWQQLHSQYRILIYNLGQERKGDERGFGKQKGFSEDQIERVEEQGGELEWPEIFKTRFSYFSHGLMLGSQIFVEDTMRSMPEIFLRRARPGPKQPSRLSSTILHTAKHCR